MNKPISTSLIVLNYNDADTTIKFIDNIQKIDEIDNIIIVDNNSTDNSYELLKQINFPTVHLIKSSANKGYAAGNNAGIKYAIENLETDILIISNPDVNFSSDLIVKAKEILLSKNDVGAVTGKMICTSQIKNPVAWKLPDWTECLIESSFILKKFLKNKLFYNNTYLSNSVCQVDVVPGSLFLIKSNVMNNVDFFDENTFLYYEENILAYKLKKNGFKNYVINIPYIHDHSVSIDKNIKSVKTKLKLCQKSRNYYCKKYLNCNCIKMLAINIIFEIGLSVYLIYKKLISL